MPMYKCQTACANKLAIPATVSLTSTKRYSLYEDRFVSTHYVYKKAVVTLVKLIGQRRLGEDLNYSL